MISKEIKTADLYKKLEVNLSLSTQPLLLLESGLPTSNSEDEDQAILYKSVSDESARRHNMSQ